MTDNLTAQFIKEVQQKTGILGNSDSIQNAVKTVIEVAATNLAVLITGETGTGKEVFASAVHNLSKRQGKPFVSVNCGAIPETLLESELFGHERGAFTSAIDQRIGFFEAANNGTIFLDEIGEMPLLTQVKLLRVLESGEFSRLGSSSIQKVDVRLIAATNRNLIQEVQEKKFRSDLFYRLNQINIALPPLREHRHDIPLYFHHFAQNVCNKNNIIYQGISDEAINELKSLNWQGNIREFKNFTEKIITLEKGKKIEINTVYKYIPPALPDVSTQNIEISNALIPVSKETSMISSENAVLLALLRIQHDVESIKRVITEIGAEVQMLKYDMNAISDMSKLSNTERENSIMMYGVDKSGNLTTIKDMERQLIVQTLEHCHYRKKEAAAMLGIAERTLYRKIEEYNIEDYN